MVPSLSNGTSGMISAPITSVELVYFLASNCVGVNNRSDLDYRDLHAEGSLLEMIADAREVVAPIEFDTIADTGDYAGPVMPMLNINVSKHQFDTTPSLKVHIESDSEEKLKDSLRQYLSLTRSRLPNFVEAYGSALAGEALSAYGKALAWHQNEGEFGRYVVNK